ncbi:HD domain-containing protein [Lacinutrix sp. Bg11-31]|uniref:HD domain-containing protein n=1 Tax=Lacinutrix sp. Bg11-31 TaxID=2057808 RepID=UPI000C30B82C|nr:HD domain-containing protein [Lacinutrix sp. Bg11-31]AUC80767.1 HD family phosphohydrolase [Lacinutrix sp. Bg11-31]
MIDNFTEIYNHVLAILNAKLPSYLTYHNTNHTLYILENAIYIAHKENVSKPDLYLLKIAALFHDTGFIYSYDTHEEKSCEIAKNELKKFNVSNEDISTICNIIRATKVPQNPKTLLENILADADLEYLATTNFKKVGDKLFEELKHFKPQTTRKKWNATQIKFIKNHHYHTSFCKHYKEHRKQKNLNLLLKL